MCDKKTEFPKTIFKSIGGQGVTIIHTKTMKGVKISNLTTFNPVQD